MLQKKLVFIKINVIVNINLLKNLKKLTYYKIILKFIRENVKI